MKHKILSIFIAFIVLIGAFGVMASAGGYGLVISSLTEVDQYGHLTSTTARATATGMLRGESSWFAYESANLTGDFTIEYELYVDSLTADTSCQGHVMIASIHQGDGADLGVPDHAVNVQLRYSVSGPTLVAEENIGASGGSSPLIISEDTHYYLTSSRTGTDWILSVYSDEDRQNLVGTRTEHLTTTPTFTVIEPMASHGFSGAYPMTFWVQNVVVYDFGAPTITSMPATDILFDEWSDAFEATVSGNVTDDGGEEVEAGFYYRVKDSGDWSWINCLGTYATGENFTADLINLDKEVTYEFYAYGFNGAGYDSGSTLEFTTSYQAEAPIIQTLAYPIEYYTDNVTIYGYVAYDGSANVTGDFQYKISDNVTWNWSTSNMTDLQTSDQFYYNIPDVTEAIQYDFRAVGTNVYGITYGDIGHFILYISVAPTMETLTYGTLTATTAWISGNVTDDGGQPVFASFNWRRLGEEDWNNTSYTLLETGESYSYKLTGLNPSTTYQYRAYGWHGIGGSKTEGYGDIHTFYTYDAINIPIMETGNWNYLNEFYASVVLECEYDGGSPVLASLQYRLSGDTVWTETTPTSGLTTGYEVSHMTYELEYGNTYEYRAKGENEQGIGYGLIETEIFIAPDDTEPLDTAITPFVDLINEIKNNLGLTGAMGTWAFMALMLLLVAVVFGSIMFTQKDNDTAKTVLGIIWALFSMAVVGAFIFTGQLGVWPIVILVGGVVVVAMVIVGAKLSGGQA